MKQIETVNAVGHMLCHDITRILLGESKGVAFKKGHVVQEADIENLLALGKEHLFVWELKPGMLHENDAARILYSIAAGEHMHPSGISEGKIEIIADADGLLVVDSARLKRVNSLGQMMIATRHSHTPVKAGDVLAGTRVIPLTIEERAMERAKRAAAGAPILALHPFNVLKCGLVTTGSEVYYGRIPDTFSPVVKDKLAEYGSEITQRALLPDSAVDVTEAILKMIGGGAQLVLVTGGMSVDPDDRTPLAIKKTGAEIITYGAPVLPGAMFMLAYLDGVPILGLPGCVMYERRTIFDIVLPQVLAGLKVTRRDIATLGLGGLCLHCAECTYPNCGFGKGN